MSSAEAVRIVEIDASPSGRHLLRRFYDESYVAQFPDPDERESLAQIGRYLKLKAQGWYGANSYHVLVALDDGVPVGGAVLDYLALPHSGVIEFLFVLEHLRGQGLGRRLLDAGLRCLRADARAQGQRLVAVAAEMNDPFRRPSKPDNMDPFLRAAMWGRWGFHKLLCPYVQPALSAEQGAVEYLTLIVRPLSRPAARSVPADWVRTLVAQYMRWAMRIRQPRRQPEFLQMDAHLAQRRRVPLLPLACSIGVDPQRPFEVHEAGQGPRHVWHIVLPGLAQPQGEAHFFSLRSAGFGQHLALDGALLALLLARIEACMMADGVARGVCAPGWFIECAGDAAPIFLRHGFGVLPAEYLSPSTGRAAHLLYKPFGAAYAPLELSRTFVLRAAREILAGVYGIDQPTRHASYLRLAASLKADEAGQVRLLASSR